jgi:Nuclease A inhibitor-like protein
MFAVMALSDSQIVDLLTVATTDLYWVSESDEPFEVLLWTNLPTVTLDETALRQQLSLKPKTTIVQQSIDDFFQPALAEGTEAIAPYEQLLFALQQQLRKLQVYRVGEMEVAVYIVGQTPAGSWIALRTLIVET